MAEKSNLLEKFKNVKLFKNKHITIAVIVCLVCIALILASSSFKKTTKKQEEQVANYSITSSALEYANAVSNNLQETINRVSGISNAKVIVVVEESPTIKYLNEADGEKQVIVYDKQGSSYKPVFVAEFLPKITGVMVVAKGVNNLAIKNNLLNAISAVYNVEISRIDILEGK